jgi:hypothetical protein
VYKRQAQYLPVDESKETAHVVKDFIQRADEAMYAVKCKGGDAIGTESVKSEGIRERG